MKEKPIAFYPRLARELGDIASALYYQQIYFWSDKGDREDGYIYKSKREIEEETTLTREQQDRIRKKLEEMGWIKTKLTHDKKGKPTIHFKCLVDIGVSISGKPTNGKVGNPLMNARETHQCSITENTTETTAEGETSSPLLKIPGIIRGSEYRPDGISPRDVQAAKPRRERTPKQKAALPILLLMDYFRDEVKRLHNLSYLHREEDRNAKVRKQIDSAYSRFQEETRLFVDWWLNGGGAWCNYEPEACFTNRAFREYENKDVIAQQPTKAKGKEVRRI